MAKELKFSLGGTVYSASPVKLERKKIYGWTDTVATDKSGNTCLSAYLSPDDAIVIPSGAIKIGTVNDDGAWVEKSSLTAFDEDGKVMPILPSSFDEPIVLDKTATDEEFLDNDWESIYQIENPELAVAMGNKIYVFEFSYRGGTNHNDGYLIANKEGLFLFAGDKQEFPLVDLQEETVIDDQDEIEEENLDDLDFSMF